MVFSSNPLALSVPDPAFESWLRDKGYLEILDERTSAIYSSSSSSNTTTTTSSAASPSSSSPSTSGPPAAGFCRAIIAAAAASLNTFASLLTLNPFAKLTADDFSAETPSWTVGFFGVVDSYSWPAGPSQARMRVQENVKRYAHNYACLGLIFCACSLYQMPIALLGLVVSLGSWEAFRLCSDFWKLEQYPTIRHILLRVLQFATAVILYAFKVQISLFCAIAVSYAVMILHASLRKLTPSKLPARADGSRRFQRNK